MKVRSPSPSSFFKFVNETLCDHLSVLSQAGHECPRPLWLNKDLVHSIPSMGVEGVGVSPVNTRPMDFLAPFPHTQPRFFILDRL